MAVDDTDYFGLISKASASNTGNWMKDGNYVLAIKEIGYTKKNGGRTWIVEMIVLWCEPIPGVFEIGGQPCKPDVPGAIQVVPTAVGQKVSFTRVTDSASVPNGPGDVKAFMLALTNTRADDFDRAEAAARAALPPATLAAPPEGTASGTTVYEIGGQICAKDAPGSTAWEWTVPEGAVGRWCQMSPFKRTSLHVVGPQQVCRGVAIRAVMARKLNKGTVKKENEGKILVLPQWQHVPIVGPEVAERRRLIDAGLPIPWPTVLPAPVAAAPAGA